MISARSLAVILAAFVAGSCRAEPKTTVPKRPSRVPSSAVWTGGSDGGSWLSCRRPTAISVRYHCVVWHDVTGEVIANGDYVLGAGPREADGTLEFDGFDGVNIYLLNGGVLEPAPKVQSPPKLPKAPMPMPRPKGTSDGG